VSGRWLFEAAAEGRIYINGVSVQARASSSPVT
jgi:hypothetical protein